MGDPKRQRKKYKKQKSAWSRTELNSELKYLGDYGLRNKRELWRHRSFLSKYRTNARKLLAISIKERSILEKQIIEKLISLKIVENGAIIDDVFGLTINKILDRRLQTIVYKHGLSKTLQQSRQFIVHGHISVKGRKVTSPSYLVKGDEESTISYSSTSPIVNIEHPLRSTILQAS